MKKKLTLSVMAMSIAATSLLSIGVFAGTQMEKIEAYLNTGVNIKIKGKDWQAKNSAGDRLYPISYNDSNYLPVRAVGEALGVEIGWDEASNTVLIGKDEPVNTVGSSRKNPAPLGTKVSFKVNQLMDKYEGFVWVDEVIRGEEAWKKISQANIFNDGAGEGKEYFLAKISVQVTKNEKADASVDINRALFTLVSGSGKSYDEFFSVVTPDPQFDSDLYVGASTIGWVAFKVDKTDVAPIITFARNYDGTGGVWFSTSK